MLGLGKVRVWVMVRAIVSLILTNFLYPNPSNPQNRIPNCEFQANLTHSTSLSIILLILQEYAISLLCPSYHRIWKDHISEDFDRCAQVQRLLSFSLFSMTALFSCFNLHRCHNGQLFRTIAALISTWMYFIPTSLLLIIILYFSLYKIYSFPLCQ